MRRVRMRMHARTWAPCEAPATPDTNRAARRRPADELGAVTDLGADFGVPTPLRFKLLHNLWSAGVPRARRVTITRVDE